jgi:hypothetical protein
MPPTLQPIPAWVGALNKPPAALWELWNDRLLEVSKYAKTPLAEDIDFYPPGPAPENTHDGRERSPDDEAVHDKQFDGINYDGMCETTGDISERSKLFPLWKAKFNPEGLPRTPDAEEEMRQQPDFQREVARYQVEFGGVRNNEAAELLDMEPNTLTKYFSNTAELEGMYPGVDFSKAVRRYFCITTRNNRDRLIILGKVSDPLSKILKAFVSEWKKSEVEAVKYARKNAKRDGVGKRVTAKRVAEAKRRIADAYNDVVIGGFSDVVRDETGAFHGTYVHFLGHTELFWAILQQEGDKPLIQEELTDA